MNKTSKALRSKIQDLICEEILADTSDSGTDCIHTIVGVLEDLKVGLLSACHETGKKAAEIKLKKNPTAMDEYMDKHTKRFEELLKRAKGREDNDGTTSTSA